MGRATLLGAAGSGRTVLLGLLYTSLVRYGSEKAGHFAFHAGPPALDLLSSLYESLRAGEVPRWPPGDAPSEVSLTLRWEEERSFGAFSRMVHPRPPSDPAAMGLTLSRMDAAQLQSFLAAKGGLTAGAEALLDGSAAIIAIDGSTIPVRRSPDPAGAHPWDPTLAALFQSLRSADRDHPSPRPRALEPLFVVTKLDQAPEPVPSYLRSPGSGTLSRARASRLQAARDLLDAHFPTASQALRPVPGANPLFAPPLLFSSWLHVDPAAGPVPRLKGHLYPDRGWEPEYAYQEFVDLIGELGTLAHQVGP
jgi:hypothetical protein